MNKKVVCKIGLLIFLASATATANAQETKPALSVKNRNAEWQALAEIQKEIAAELAPVKSQADLRQHLQQNARGAIMLRKLSPASYRIFIDSLVFNEKGLASFNYGVLEDELSVSEAYEVLSMFGMQHTVHHLPGLKAKTKTDLLIRQMLASINENAQE